MSDYNNKRKQMEASNPNMTGISNLAKKAPAVENDYDDDDEDDDFDEGDDWGDVDKPNTKKLDNFDYKNTNLNQCSDAELQLHKAKMDEGFS